MWRFAYVITSIVLVKGAPERTAWGDGCATDCNNFHWSYVGDARPVCWPNCYSICGGQSQSPIDVKTNSIQALGSVPPLQKQGYSQTRQFTGTNNGHSVSFSPSDGTSSINVQGLSLPSTYTFASFHFHWGSNSGQGSEHTLDGNAYPMEMHLVHYSSQYSNLSAAQTQPQGLAVLGFFFQISQTDNNNLDPVVNALSNLKFKGNTVSATLSLDQLLPSDASNFYRYSGSLTTPTCDETVVWTLFKQPIAISESQLEYFRSLLYSGSDASSHRIVDNFRPTQALNGRQISSGAADWK